MVFAIGNHNDCLANTLVGRKAAGSQLNGSLYVGSLTGNKRRRDCIKEYLGRYKVAGYGQLHECIACKYYQSNLVVLELVNQIGYYTLGLFKTAWSNIIGKH